VHGTKRLRTLSCRMTEKSANVGDTVGVGYSESVLWVVPLTAVLVGRIGSSAFAIQCWKRVERDEGSWIVWQVVRL